MRIWWSGSTQHTKKHNTKLTFNHKSSNHLCNRLQIFVGENKTFSGENNHVQINKKFEHKIVLFSYPSF